MAQQETVTVRMARGERSTPWGFGVTELPNREVVIVNVIPNSLADRAGLHDGDILDVLEGLNNLDINAVDRLLVTSHDKIELVVHRQAGGQARIWRPEITENPNMRRSFSGNPPPADERPYRVSLEHNSDSRPPQGFNQPAMPFNTDPRVKHLQYNSPMNLYSQQNVAESYVQQTAGIVDSQDAGYARQQNQEPAYLRSETLREIKNQERGGGQQTLSNHPNPNSLPICNVCGRPILGVMARAAGQDLHGDCLACATCGNSLRNVGHHFIEGKFYCEVHGRQKKGLPAQVMDPNLAVKTTPTHAQPVRQGEGVRAPYQPEVLARRPLSVSPGPGQTQTNVYYGTPKTQGAISPQTRGVPSSGLSAADFRPAYQKAASPQPMSHPVQTQHVITAPPPPSNPPPAQAYTRSEQTTLRKEQNGYSGAGGAPAGGAIGGAPRGGLGADNRGTGALRQGAADGRTPYCEHCKQQIRGAFVLATGLAWCPEHFVCANKACGRRLLECGFVEEAGQKYCEGCFEQNIAPRCAKCAKPIVSDCLNALQKKWHPTCFTCAHCQKPFGNSAFYLENGLPYCENDWNALFTTKCVNCRYPIEAGDRWVEALGSAFHSNCFNCTRCNANLEGESFYAKNGQPFCKLHA